MSISANLQAVRERIAEAAGRIGREPESVRLIGISSGFKGVPLEAVIEAVSAGLEDLGENRIQDAATRIPAVIRGTRGKPHRWHLVGHLQTNKAKAAVGLFDCIHSVDSLRIAVRLNAVAPPGGGPSIYAFLEVQFVQQANRFGFTPETVQEAFEKITYLRRMSVVGLMTVAPPGLSPEETRPVFRRLRELRDAIQDAHPELTPLGLSMGMTDDYEVAIEEGSTAVRLGRAIFS